MSQGEQLLYKQPLHIHRFYKYNISYKTEKYETKLSISYSLINLLIYPFTPTYRYTILATEYVPNWKMITAQTTP
jgi:hypothetical protein